MIHPRSAAPTTSTCEILEHRITPAVIYAITDVGQFIAFDSSDPSTYLVNESISGLAAGFTIEGLDIRPATGELYALAVSNGPNADDTAGRLYKIDKQTGAATQVGGTFSTTLVDNVRYGFDFNPTVDRIRVVNGADQNFRLNPNDGAAIPADAALDNGSINGAAYDRNFPGANVTTLFGIDFTSDSLVRIGGVDGEPSPNGGTVTTVGSLGVSLQSGTGFDIGPDGTTYLAATVFNTDSTRLYSVNLTTGAATNLGLIMDTLGRIRGMAVEIPQVTISPDGRSATYTDVDGDLVTVRTTKGTFDSSDFVLFSAGHLGGAQLSRLILSDDGLEFSGAKLAFTTKRAATGDGRVNVGWIDSTGFNLGAVNVNGDLGKITAGDGNADGLALASLKVKSMGVAGLATQGTGGNLSSKIQGNLGPVVIQGDMFGASFDAAFGKNTSFFIGGSFGVKSPAVVNGPSLLLGTINTFTVGKDIIGGDGALTGYVSVSAKTIRVGGNLIGGLGALSGTLDVGNANSVFLGGDIRGDIGGGVLEVGQAKTVKLGGSVFGATGGSGGRLGVSIANSVMIGGNLVGGSIEGNESENLGGTLRVGKVKSVMVKGSVISGVDFSTGELEASGLIAIDRSVSSLTIKGSLIGNATHPVRIVAAGSNETNPFFINQLTIGGSVTWAEILIGWVKTPIIEVADGDGSIGQVKVGGDWTASSLVAGVNDVNGDGFGNTDDIIIALDNDGSIVSRISSITIKGSVLGSSVPGDRFAFTAEEIGSISIAGKKLALSPTQDDFFPLPSIQTDVFVREL